MAKQTLLAYIFFTLIFATTFSCPTLLAASNDVNEAPSLYESFLLCLASNINSSQVQASDIVYSKSNASYTSVLRAYIRNARYNTSATPKPLIIVTPKQISHVQAAVVCTKKAGYQLKIRSGGHDFDGTSYVSDSPFFVLDMSNLRSIEVDIQDESASVQAGATLGELYYKIWEKSRVHGFPAGVCTTVGVGGHLSGGGYGNMMRKYGLSVDHIVDAQIVDVKGRLLDREAMGEDLFWAIRGGGGASFGVVISYKIKLVQVPETVTVFRIARTLEQNATDLVLKWQDFAPSTTDDLFMRLILRPTASMINQSELTITASFVTMYLGQADSLLSLLSEEFPELRIRKEDCLEMSWINSTLWWSSLTSNRTSPDLLLVRIPDHVKFLKRKSDFVQNPISQGGLEYIWKKMIEAGNTGLFFSPYGGRMSEIPVSASPFPHRAGNLWKIEYSANWQEQGIEVDKKYMTQIRRLYSYMTPFVSKNPRRAFLNYRDLDIGVMEPGKNCYEVGKVYGKKYFNCNFDRLVKVKTTVDPENFFRNEQSIPALSCKV